MSYSYLRRCAVIKRHAKNIRLTESYLRVILATMLLMYVFENGSVLSLIMSIYLYYTAFTSSCMIFEYFKINDAYRMENHYLSLLPDHNSSAVLIFDEVGKVLYKNSAVESELAGIISSKDVGITESKKIIVENRVKRVIFEYGGRSYQTEVKGIAKEKSMLAYITDVTELVELNKAVEDTQRDIIYAMGEIGETRSKETGNHVKRVAHYSEILALLYGLSQEESSRLKMASPMHDIGKVGIPDAILNAPRRLSEAEFEVMKTHAVLGYDMLKSSHRPILQAAAIVAHEHHECFDGSGYPRGLKGEDIHIYGRITAVADVFDALSSKRVYKKAWPLAEVLAYFDQQSGYCFDPVLVKLLVDNLHTFVQIGNKYVDDMDEDA